VIATGMNILSSPGAIKLGFAFATLLLFAIPLVLGYWLRGVIQAEQNLAAFYARGLTYLADYTTLLRQTQKELGKLANQSFSHKISFQPFKKTLKWTRWIRLFQRVMQQVKTQR
jgi:hypothetical protein